MKRFGLGAAFLATTVAAWFAPSLDGDTVVLSEHARKASARTVTPGSASISKHASSASSLEVLAIRPRGEQDNAEVTGAFAMTQWDAPVPSVVKRELLVTEMPLPELQLPSLPFRVLGHYIEDAQVVVFLQYGEQNMAVRAGDTIAGQYKVESLSDGVVTLLYIPLNQKQTLQFGPAK